MALTKEAFIEEVKEHFNELALDGMTVVRVIGCGETEEDYYYILDKGYGHHFLEYGTGVYRTTAVGQPYYLKGVLPEKDYEELDRLRSLNGADKVEHFIWEDM